MEKYQFWSPRRRRFEQIRKWVAIASGMFSAFGFWGMLAVIVVRYFFKISEEDALMFVGFPTGLVVLIYLCINLPKLARAMGFDDH